MNISLLSIPIEITKIIKALEIPIDGLNFMPGERQAELRYKGKTIGYILCFDENNIMNYKTTDVLTQKHLDWHFIYRQNQKLIDVKVSEVLKKKPSGIIPSSFRQLQVRTSPDSLSPVAFECRFDGKDWHVYLTD